MTRKAIIERIAIEFHEYWCGLQHQRGIAIADIQRLDEALLNATVRNMVLSGVIAPGRWAMPKARRRMRAVQP